MRPITPRTAKRYYLATHILATATGFTVTLATVWLIKYRYYANLDALATDERICAAITLTGITFLIWMTILRCFETELAAIHYWENRLNKYPEPFPETDEERAAYREWAWETLANARSKMQDAATALLICEVGVKLFENGEAYPLCIGGPERYAREFSKKQKELARARKKAAATKATFESHKEFLHAKWRLGAGILRPESGGNRMLAPEPTPEVYV